MASPERRLIINADDFGRSHSINQAVIRAHREGVLTSASLMVNEAGFDEAVELARASPRLGVGLHLTLVCGHSALSHQEIPDLVTAGREFGNNPALIGLRYFAKRKLREQLQAEIRAQFEKFRNTGLPLDHVNGHLHFHLHPVVLNLLIETSEALGLRHARLTREPFWMDVPLASGRRLYRAGHAAIFFCLAGRAVSQFKRKNIRHAQRVFGLLQDSRVNEDYILKLLEILPSGDSELYSHPSLDEFKHEFDALISRRVKEQIERLAIQLIRYQDL